MDVPAHRHAPRSGSHTAILGNGSRAFHRSLDSGLYAQGGYRGLVGVLIQDAALVGLVELRQTFGAVVPHSSFSLRPR